jgi:predicted transposase/invertase (TIGR01784 family)
VPFQNLTIELVPQARREPAYGVLRAKWLAKGRAKGLAEGRAKGLTEGKKESARKMKADGVSPEKIHEYTGLPPEEIRRL